MGIREKEKQVIKNFDRVNGLTANAGDVFCHIMVKPSKDGMSLLIFSINSALDIYGPVARRREAAQMNGHDWRVRMSEEKMTILKLLEETVGIRIKIISNDYREILGYEGQITTHQEIVFQVEEEEPDHWAIGVLFCLSLMSFTYSAPREMSAIEFVPDEEWNLGYFVQGLRFWLKNICFTSDYVSGRLMKTDIDFEPGGKVNLTTRNRGRGAERWLTNLQGKKHVQAVK